MTKFARRIRLAFENRLVYQMLRLSAIATVSLVASNIHNVIGMVMVGHVGSHSTEQISAMGTALLIFLVFSYPMNSFGSASQHPIASAWGAGDVKSAIDFTKSAMIMSFLFSLLIGLIIFMTGHKLVGLTTTDPKVREYATKFLLIRILGLPFSAVSFVIRAFFDAVGRPKYHLRFNFLSTLVCIILSPFFIFGVGFPRLEVQGFALASSISGLAAMILGLAYLRDYVVNEAPQIQAPYRKTSAIRPYSSLLKNLKISTPAFIAQIIATITFILFIRIAETQGVEHQAATFILVNMLSIFFLPSFAVGATLAGLYGRLIGNGEFKKAKKLMHDTTIVIGTFATALSVIFFLAPDRIIGIFSHDELVIDVGSKIIRVFSPGVFFMITGMILLYTFIGIGRTKFVLMVELVLHILFLVPLLLITFMVADGNTTLMWATIALYFAIIFLIFFTKLLKLQEA